MTTGPSGVVNRAQRAVASMLLPEFSASLVAGIGAGLGARLVAGLGLGLFFGGAILLPAATSHASGGADATGESSWIQPAPRVPHARLQVSAPRADAPAGTQPVGTWWDRTAPPPGGTLPGSVHYTIRSDLDLETTRLYAAHMDTMFVEYSRRLAALPQRLPHVLNVFMFERRSDYVETLRTQFGIDATGSAGMFFVTQRGAGLAFFVEDIPRSRILHVIQHEGFHQFAYSRFGTDLPIWANEGLAEFFGFAVVIGREVVIGQSSPWTLAALREAIEADATIPFIEMITMTTEGWNARVRSRQAALQYQQAWSMVHFLVFGDGGRYREAFERYLRLLNTGMPSEPAFVDAFQTSNLDAFQDRWRSYVLNDARPGSFVAALERLEFLAEGMLALERAGKRPMTFDQLRDALVETKFVHRIERHGYAAELRADNPLVFEIPQDDQNRQEPTFAVERPRPPRTVRDRQAEAERPMPASIRTQSLRPRNLTVRWIRTDNGFTYDIDAR